MARRHLHTIADQFGRLPGVGRHGDDTDRELLDQYRRGHPEDVFCALVRRHGPMVKAVCRRVLADGHLAEDAFQATFLVLARRAGTIRSHEALGG